MVGLTNPPVRTITSEELASFNEQGFLIISSPEVTALKESLGNSLKRIALKIIDQFDETREYKEQLAASSFADLIDWCVAHEVDGRVSRAFYEIFPYLPEVISVVSNPLLNDVAHQLGLNDIIPSTLPLIRIDRPNDHKFRLQSHQDYWFSMLSGNSITFWMPLVELLPDMGLLQGIPGSHKNGFVPFRQPDPDIPFVYVPVEEMPEPDFVELPLASDELLVFNQYFMHRSGFNGSPNTRVTIQVRFNDFDTLETITSSFTPGYSNYVLDRYEEILNPTTQR